MRAHKNRKGLVPLMWLLGVLPTCAQSLPATSRGESNSIQSPIRVHAYLVDLPIAVTDREGNFIENLSQENFRILDSGLPQKIVLFEPRDLPVTVGLLVDHSASMASKLPEVSAAAAAFVKSSNPRDQLFVVNFNETVSLMLPATVSFTSDPNALVSAIGGSSARGQTALYDAVIEALAHLKQSEHERQALIIVTDGGDNASRHTFQQTVAAVMKSQALVYCIGIFGAEDPDAKPGELKKLAKLTGGEAYFPQNVVQVADISRKIADILRKDYVLGFLPSAQASPKSWRPVRVLVSAPGKQKLTIRTRAGYVFSGNDAVSNAGQQEKSN
jgi:Ca-activated chloride channel homolog